MAKKKIEEEKTDLAPEQMSDILLVMDKKELSLNAVSKIDKDGKAKTVPADEKHQNDFLKIDYSSNLFTNFISNFWNQATDPSRFRLFKLNFGKFKEFNEAVKSYIEGKDTPEVKKFLENYEIKPKNLANKNSTNNKKEDIMAKQNQTNQQAAETGKEAPKNRFNESMINWEQLKKFDLSREVLVEKGLLDSMLKGYKSNDLVPVAMNFGSVILRCDARLSFQQSKDGQVALAINGIRKEPEFNRPYFGHTFTKEDITNLKETGNMGRVVELKNRTGDLIPSYISIDEKTREVVSMKAENLKIPDEIKSIKLSKAEKEDLRDGKAIYLEGLISDKGKEFNAFLQVNADRGGISFRFENDKMFNRQEIGGVKLTETQTEALNSGKAIFVEDMERKDGEKFSSFVSLNEASGKLQYTRYNPDTPEDAREIYVPKEMGGVPLTPEDRELLREGKPVYIENMINRKGEEYSSFVKLDLRTGQPQFSKTPDGFTERPEFKIPAEIWGVTPTATQRAALQDGKAVEIKGMKGFDGKEFNSFVRVNGYQGKLEYFNENPDLKKDVAKRNVIAEKQDNKNDQKAENPRRRRNVA